MFWGISVGVPEEITAYGLKTEFLVLDCDFLSVLISHLSGVTLLLPKPRYNVAYRAALVISNVMYIYMLSYRI